MRSRLFSGITLIGMLIIFSAGLSPAAAGPITGGTGSKIQMNFMYQDPDPAEAGKYIDLRWQIVNTVGGTTENLRFRLEAGYPFTFDAGDTPDKYLGTSAGTNDKEIYYILHYKLKVADSALKGTYNVTLGWTTGEGWTKKDFPVYIDPRQSDFVVGALVTSPEKLIADTDEAKLSVNIDNIGKGKAENVKVKLLLPEGFKPTYSYSDEDSLGIIDKGSSKEATFYVDINENITEGEYGAKLNITYRDENDEDNQYRTKTLDLRIPIKPAPHLIIESIASTPENIVPGGKADILIKVRNAGNEKAQSVSLRVFKDSSQPFEFSEKSDFIGKLEPGESGEAVIRLGVDGAAAAKKYLLDVELRGIDQKENVVVFRRTVPLTVAAESGSPLKSMGLLLGAVVVLGGAGAAYYLKNGRRKSL
ncbi:MAG: NEW3 domain-containing protein [Candidatus Methanoperedens sp.]|nr:NEW3 domain-containing protein [Candidatus Methanoperedens sp.]